MLLDYLASGDTIALLDVNPGLVIWTTVTFTIVLLVLKRYAWKPITSALDARAEKIHADIERAETLKNEAEKKLEEHTSKVNALREESKQILAEARTDAERLKQEILESARREA
ncbi:MAG: ATP F0F1 synthase subunit B, partial [Spirochaetia bacterium]|nr:ATP F0F1 synthase subunit B [Spirochaetia bacterium]